MSKKINDKTITCIAVVTSVIIIIYEFCTCYTFLNLKQLGPICEFLNLKQLSPIWRILSQLSYAYIGSYIFYILLGKKDENNNKKRSKRILQPMLEGCIGVYKEFIEGFMNYEIQNKDWKELNKEEFINLGKCIDSKDEYKHCRINYFFTEKEKEYAKTYLTYTIYILSKILKELEEIRVGLNILDERIGENIWTLIKEIKNANKAIYAIRDAVKGEHLCMTKVMECLFECHKLIVRLDNSIKQVYGY